MTYLSEVNKKLSEKPFLGYGLGLRPDYYEQIIKEKPEVDWFEIISENYMIDGGKPLYYLDKIREHYPIVMHGVSLSIGGTDPLDKDYLHRLKELARRVQPEWISDHLCWTSHGGHNVHDLMPVPHTQEAITHIADRVKQVQDYLGRQILLENPSTYVSFVESQMTEWAFLNAIVEKADCLVLLDINNIYVSSVNHDFDPMEYIKAIPAERVWQHHLAGHTDNGNHIIDTHDHPIVDNVWELYAKAVEHFGSVSAMIERDNNMPPFEELMAEFEEMKNIAQNIIGKHPEVIKGIAS